MEGNIVTGRVIQKTPSGQWIIEVAGTRILAEPMTTERIQTGGRVNIMLDSSKKHTKIIGARK